MTRQYFFDNEIFLNYHSLTSIMVKENNIDYRKLPAKVSQQTLKLVEQNFKSFFNHLKVKKKNEVIKPNGQTEKNAYFILKGACGVFLWKENNFVCPIFLII